MKMEWKTEGWARARSSPYDESGEGLARDSSGEGQALALREGVAFFIVARGPVPRDVGKAEER